MPVPQPPKKERQREPQKSSLPQGQGVGRVIPLDAEEKLKEDLRVVKDEPHVDQKEVHSRATESPPSISLG